MATWRCDVKTTIQAPNVRNRPARVGGRAMGETLGQGLLPLLLFPGLAPRAVLYRAFSAGNFAAALQSRLVSAEPIHAERDNRFSGIIMATGMYQFF
jgi:hypothetical protein